MNARLTVSDWPVARNSDPMTSVEAGENQQAREASEIAVLNILHFADQPLTSYQIADRARRDGLPWTEQRLRTALAQLGRKGLAMVDGVRKGASPTGRSATTWRLAEGANR